MGNPGSHWNRPSSVGDSAVRHAAMTSARRSVAEGILSERRRYERLISGGWHKRGTRVPLSTGYFPLFVSLFALLFAVMCPRIMPREAPFLILRVSRRRMEAVNAFADGTSIRWFRSRNFVHHFILLSCISSNRYCTKSYRFHCASFFISSHKLNIFSLALSIYELHSGILFVTQFLELRGIKGNHHPFIFFFP